VESASPGVGSEASALLKAGADHIGVVVPTLINQLAALDGQVALILDDYHTVDNPVVHREFSFLIDRMPAMLRLVIATRSDPLLPLARLRAQGELLEIRTEHLRFLEGEAAQLLTEVLGLWLTDDQVGLLVRRTEGWAAGLYLAALSLVGRGDAATFLETFAGDNRHIVDYLIAEVLDGQAPERRSFLLRTSLLRRLSGALCDATLETSGSASVLEQIERENLFVTSLDASRDWYRYHQLFAELLRVHLHDVEPELVPRLHQRAADWLAAEGLIDDAVHHLAAAGDTIGRADLIAEHWVSEYDRGRLSTISRWLDELPGETVSADPRLSVARGWIALNSEDFEVVDSWIKATEAALASDPADGDSIGLRFDVLRAAYQFKVGNMDAALARARAVITRDRSNTPMGRAAAYATYGSALYFTGDTIEAQAAYRRAVRLADEAGNHRASVYALGCLAMIAAEHGRLSEARRLIGRATGMGRGFTPKEQFAGLMASHLATAIVFDGEGDTPAALDAIEMAMLARHGTGFVELAKALMVKAQILTHSGDLEAAEASRSEAAGVLQGRVDAALAHRLLAGTVPTDGAVSRGATADEEFTSKELEVLGLLRTRLSRREIGDRLYVSLNTVKTHQRGLYRKLGVDNRAQAVSRARDLGLLQPVVCESADSSPNPTDNDR
jgi:LuxR family maltose regulon positive regulatory protein